MLTTKRAVILTGLLIIASLAAGLIAWPSLPASMATHWGASGDANGYSGKAFGVLFVPILSIVMAALLFLLPQIDPLAKGFRAFRKEYDGLVLLLIGFMTLVQGAVLAWNLGARFEFTQIIGPGIGLLFYYIGAIMPQMKRNWFAGIRTPWTLSSDRVWEETHRVGGKLFRISGFLACLGAVFPDQAFLLIFIPIVASSLGVIVYSYRVYRKGA